MEIAGEETERSFTVHPEKIVEAVSFRIIILNAYVTEVDADATITLFNGHRTYQFVDAFS